jgi:threonyl-tRNA synthetase
VIGDKEVEAGTVAVRHRKQGDLGAKPVDAFIEEIRAANASKVTEGQAASS